MFFVCLADLICYSLHDGTGHLKVKKCNYFG